ncbi:protein disulfide isomerase-like 2-3 [Lactuca sativa]|uniref:Thioredoxin domain-containing protein n=1 Tax=Lactuca sativa TaxID=4236 RepID=A0A9R1WWR3_LACSA|nr:protein disulfide isomerase-like 2-3 [Lactuca sativa]KAJ0188207.1 hypothetical protein LSAT_V11C900498450 [Lactuca sativa]
MNRSANVLILISFFFLSFTSNLNLVDAAPEQLNQKNFDEKVMKSKDVWFIMFGLPTCGTQKAFLPEWEAFSKLVDGKIKLGEVNVAENYDLYVQYKIKSYPTIITFAADKSKGAFEYTGTRTAQKMEEAANLKLEGKGY